MKKIAVFVEGQTEQIFIKKLFTEIAGAKHIDFNVEKISNAVFLKQSNQPDGNNARIFASIIDCSNDSKVTAAIIDNHASLKKSGYELVLGLRDLYPKPLADLQRISRLANSRVPTAGLPAKIHLAVMEVEAWFLLEYKHYCVISEHLTEQIASTISGFDIKTGSPEAAAHPSETLSKIYNTVGMGYKKTRNQVERTVTAMDYENLYFDVRSRAKHFDDLISSFEDFLA